MKKNQTLASRFGENLKHYGLIALAIAVLIALVASTGIGPALADEGADSETALAAVMGVVVGIVKTASTAIGAVIVLWGVFQIVLAFRREDSEGISKQITTVVVGTILCGFGIFVDDLLDVMGVDVEEDAAG